MWSWVVDPSTLDEVGNPLQEPLDFGVVLEPMFFWPPLATSTVFSANRRRLEAQKA